MDKEGERISISIYSDTFEPPVDWSRLELAMLFWLTQLLSGWYHQPGISSPDLSETAVTDGSRPTTPHQKKDS